jgi:hypothetical protein
MQLDDTHVVIRVRTLTEISDLAMVMIRSYPAASIFGFALGAFPWALLNGLLLGWIPISEFQLASYDQEMAASLFKYQLLMALLVFTQTPIAGVFTTLYVGQAVFESQPTWKSVFNEAKKTFGRWFWGLGIVRGPIPLMALIALNWGNDISYDMDYVWPIALVACVAILRGNRPFMPEILLLERCPIFIKRKSKAVSARKRSAALHRPIAGELFGRFIAMSVLLGSLAMLGFYSLLWLRGTLFSLWEWDALVYLFLYPLALWAAGALSVLVRFLSYLDTRIRLEGWEIQLAVRAEAIRQFGEMEQATENMIEKGDVLNSRGVGV